MKSNVKFWLLIAALGIIIISCQKEDNVLELNEQVLEEQTSSALVDEVQHQKRTCGSDQLMTKLLNKPAYRKMHENKLMKVEKELQLASKNACTSPKVIPVSYSLSKYDWCLNSLFKNVSARASRHYK